MGRLILHIGTHKTGTTSIQRTLALYRGSLLRNGIRYPDYAAIGKKGHYAHIGVANALADDHPTLTQADAETFFAAVRDSAGTVPVTLISAESMYRQTIGPVTPQQAASVSDYWDMRDAYIARLRQVVGPAEAVIVVRKQADFAESMYQEHVKVTRYSSDFARYLEEFWFHFQYRDQVLAWRRHFGAVRILPFEALKGANIAKRFLLMLDLKPGRLETVEMQNVSLPHDAVILKRAMNGSAASRERLTHLATALGEPGFRAVVQPGKRSFFATAEARQAFQDSFAAQNRDLALMAGLPDATLFAPIPDTADVLFGDTLLEGEARRLLGHLDAGAQAMMMAQDPGPENKAGP